MVEKEGRNITDIMVKNWHGEKKENCILIAARQVWLHTHACVLRMANLRKIMKFIFKNNLYEAETVVAKKKEEKVLNFIFYTLKVLNIIIKSYNIGLEK